MRSGGRLGICLVVWRIVVGIRMGTLLASSAIPENQGATCPRRPEPPEHLGTSSDIPRRHIPEFAARHWRIAPAWSWTRRCATWTRIGRSRPSNTLRNTFPLPGTTPSRWTRRARSSPLREPSVFGVCQQDPFTSAPSTSREGTPAMPYARLHLRGTVRRNDADGRRVFRVTTNDPTALSVRFRRAYLAAAIDDTVARVGKCRILSWRPGTAGTRPDVFSR